MPAIPELRFDQLYRYEALRDAVDALAAARPDLVAVDVIGQSHEGRDIFLVTVTNTATGPADEKPALFVEANIHATEVTGSTAALHLIYRLVSGYGTDAQVTAVLDSRAFYVVPRLNPDGVERALADKPEYVRSSVRPYPRTDQQDGLIERDIDGDGRILTMRIPDPHGPWKAYPEDPRLLVAREPDDLGPGPYYRLLPEGEIQNYDGVLVPLAPKVTGLDMNRNFPAAWRPEGDQHGAGPFPTSEPEIRALVAAVVERPNVCGYIAYHTYSGVHLRPYSDHADDHFAVADLRTYQAIGARATAITGYKAASVFHDFQYDPKNPMTGASDDWAYDHLGVYSWTTEFWGPLQQAGIEDFHFINWYAEHPLEDDLKLLRWNDEKLDGRGYVDWYPFDHPQLGSVELGGWDFFRCWSNPPAAFMAEEIAPHADFALFHLAISPRLKLHSAEAVPLTGGAWKVRFVVQNTGWLATNVTQKAVERKAVRDLEVEIHLPDGATLEGGDRRVVLGQLAGRVGKTNMLGGAPDPTADRAKAEWVVQAAPGTVVRVEARHPRAGVVRADVRLEAPPSKI